MLHPNCIPDTQTMPSATNGLDALNPDSAWLQEYLDSLQRRLNAPPTPQQQQPPLSPPPMVRSALCYSLFGLRAELLTITDWAAPLEHVRQRECIVITARVHPGETCASWIMQVRNLGGAARETPGCGPCAWVPALCRGPAAAQLSPCACWSTIENLFGNGGQGGL